MRGLIPKVHWAAAGLLLALAAAPAAAAPKVVVSLKPLHSLVAGVMEGIGTPVLLIAGAGSPHAASLRPSQARALSHADLVFWIGPDMEGFLEKPLDALVAEARVTTLAELDGADLLPARRGGAWQAHDQDDTGKTTGEQAKHRPGTRDMHLWLDPRNAAAIVRAAVAALSGADPENAPRYDRNGERMVARIRALDRRIAAALAPLRDRPYVVFHDAYQYFERRYGLRALGSVTLSPERAPGARRLREIRRKIVALEAACVFSEPQFRPALVATVIEDTAARTGVLDPLGSDLTPGPGLYVGLMEALARSLAACLAQPA